MKGANAILQLINSDALKASPGLYFDGMRPRVRTHKPMTRLPAPNCAPSASTGRMSAP